MSTSSPSAPTRSWFGHPPGLTILFLTEMWEMFSFFGMRALLVYYMTSHRALPQADASLIYGGYAALVYFTPIFGGWLADRWLGRRRAVVLGGAIMAAGHFMMASDALFYPALVTIAVGNGLFLPGLASQIEQLYLPGDSRAKLAYNVYYVGVNLGAFLAPLVCGTLGEHYGWHVGFAAAGIGMLASLLIYLAGTRYLPPDTRTAQKPGPSVAAPPLEARRRRWGLLLLIAGIVVIFRGAYEQVGNTVALWIEQDVDRHVSSSIVIPMTWFQSLDSLVVFVASPMLIARWSRLQARGRETPALSKMAFGAALVGLAYLGLALAARWSLHAGLPLAWPWMAGWFVLMTVGELYILPTGLGLFGRMAPAGYRATSIALWFFAGFFGNLFAGAIGTLWQRLPRDGFFMLVAGVAVVAGLLLQMTGRGFDTRGDQAAVRAGTATSD
ncbi:peptide MFS transporter [Frateuria aurantia]